MAIIVEDGTGKTDAESYISVADADTYFSNRGNVAWAALSEPGKEAALRQATDYMLSVFRWNGTRTSATQALDWPRSGAMLYGHFLASNVVPEVVRRACAELAVRASTESLSPDTEPFVTEKTIGPLTTKYAASSRPQSEASRFPGIAGMLSDLLDIGAMGGGNQVKLVRG